MVKFNFRALFDYEDGPKTFADAEKNEGGIIVEFAAESMSDAHRIVGQFLNTHGGIDSEIEFIEFDPIVKMVQD